MISISYMIGSAKVAGSAIWFRLFASEPEPNRIGKASKKMSISDSKKESVRSLIGCRLPLWSLSHKN